MTLNLTVMTLNK